MPTVQPTEPVQPQPGQLILERYRIERALGSGSFSQVYGAYDLLKKRHVALKWLHVSGDKPGPDEPLEARDRLWLRHEFALLAGLEHEAIVEVYDFHELASGGGFFSMQWCPATHFSVAAKNQNQAWFVKVSAQVLSALAHLHAHGMVHCDIKPENVLVADDGRVTLVDFGLSIDPSKLRSERPRGTLRYVAPEALRGDGDTRLDLFAWGRVLEEALLGRGLGDTNDSAPVASVHTTEPSHQVSEAFVRWVESLAQPALEQRFQTAQAALAALAVIDRDAASVDLRTSVPPLSRLPWPMVGREAEVRLLVSLAKRAMNSTRAHLAVITGANGIGKTQFTKAVAAQIRRELMPVLRLARHDAELRLSPAKHDKQSVQLQALECLATTQDTPIWIIDDADKLTGAAWDVLWRLLELCEERPFCVLLTCNEGSLPARLSNVEVLMNDRASRIDLRTFSRKEVERLAHRAVGAPLPERWLSALFEAGAGVPLLTRQVLDAWHADGLIESDALSGEAPALPPVTNHGLLHAHVLQRMSSIDEVLWPTVFAAAVLGREITLDRLGRLVPRPNDLTSLDEHLEDTLVALGQQALIERLPSGPRFIHDSYIKALRALIPPAKKQALHTQTAALFQDSDIADFHTLRGSDPVAAAQAALRSAQRAQEKHDHRRALARLVRGYERLPSFELAFTAAHTAHLHGDQSSARQWWEKAKALPHQGDDEARLEILAAELALHGAQHQRTIELCRRILRRASDAKHHPAAMRLLARAELELGHTSEAAELLDQLSKHHPLDFDLVLERIDLALRRGRQDQAELHLERADALQTNELSPERRAKLFLLRGQWLSETGQYWLALDYLQEAKSVARQVGDRLLESRTLKCLALIRRQQGQYEEARELNLRARRYFLAHDARSDLADCAFELAKLEARAAAYSSALEHLAEVLSVRRDRHDALGRAYAQASLARLHLDLGLTRETLHYGELALRQAQRSNDAALALYAEVLMVAAETHRPEWLSDLAERASHLGIVRLEVSILLRLLIESGFSPNLLPRIDALAQTVDSIEARILAAWANANAAQQAGRLEQAETHLRRALSLMSPADNRELRIRLQSDLGEVLLGLARPRDALAELVMAMTELRDIYRALPSHKNTAYLHVAWRTVLQQRFQRSAQETG